jgi:uncharacterized protein (TIGR02099 family)
VTGFVRRLWRISAATFAVVVILLAVIIGLFRLALTQVPEHREQIQAWASEAIGLPVELGGVDARFTWRGPELGFSHTRILSAEDRSVLIAAREGGITISVLPLLTGRVVPSRIRLAGVGLNIARTEDGRWQPLGPEGPTLDPGGGGSLPLIRDFPVSEVGLADLEVRFEDRQAGLGPWEFAVSRIDLVARGDAASLEAVVGLPPVLGRGVSLEARIDGQDAGGLPLGWSATIDAQGLDLAMARGLFPGGERFPSSGAIDARLELAGSGLRPERLVGRVDAEDLAVPASVGGPSYDRLALRFDWSGGQTGWQLRLSDLDVERAGRLWSSPTARLEVAGEGAGRVVYGDADFLRLEDLAPAAALLGDEQADRVAALNPRGGLRSLVVRTGPAADGEPPPVEVRVSLEDVAIDPAEGLPGISGLSGRVEGSPGGGRFEMNSRDLSLLFPGLFRDPLVFADFDATVDWRRDDGGMTVEALSFAGSNPDLAVEGKASLGFHDDGSPIDMEIYAQALDVDLSSASRYLPVGIMPTGVVSWLDRGIVSGRSSEARLEIRGPSSGFPYREDQGLFRVAFPVEGLVLDYAEGWPRADAIRADILFENEGFFADVKSGKLMALDAGPVAVQIPDLDEGQLGIKGQAAGPAAAARDWALATDLLREILAAGLEPARVQRGRLGADVDLLLPLGDVGNNDVKVDLRLADVDIQFDFLGAPVEKLDGRVSIHGPRVTGDGLNATLTGRPVEMTLGPVASGATRLGLSGRAGVDTIDALFGLGFGNQTKGDFAYEGYLEFPSGGSSDPFNLAFRSDLVGVSIDAPAPAGKTTEEPRPVELSVAFPEGDAQEWLVRLSDGPIAAFRLERDGEDTHLGRVRNPPEGLPAPSGPGVLLGGRVPRISAMEWVLFNPEGMDGGGTGLAEVFAGASVQVDELYLPTGVYSSVHVDIARRPQGWQIRFDGEEVRGTLDIPDALFGGDQVRAQMELLHISPPSPETEGEAGVGSAQAPEPAGSEDDGVVFAPTSVPPFFLTVEDLRLANVRLGSALLDVVTVPGGIEIKRFDGGGETFSFQATGRAVQSDAEDRSGLRLKLESTDIGATLADMGFAAAMTGESGRFDIDVNWEGGLGASVLATMEGTAGLDLKKGTLSAVDTGAGRIFGLLSLQALPRRLTLDFSDVFSGGLMYDEITGDFKIYGGDAYTTNLVLRGPTVDMGVVGRIGLVDRDYDQMAVISADLGAAVPVAGAVVAGPIVGAALWVLSEALKNPVRTQITYKITGPWQDPAVEKVAGGTPPPEPRPQPAKPGKTGEGGQ